MPVNNTRYKVPYLAQSEIDRTPCRTPVAAGPQTVAGLGPLLPPGLPDACLTAEYGLQRLPTLH